MVMKTFKFEYAPIKDGFEVLLYSNKRARQIAFCKLESDAKDIIEALNHAYFPKVEYTVRPEYWEKR